jgi:hypothetical protein
MANLQLIVDCFDNTTKLRFRNSDEPQYIKFGGARDNDPTFKIRFGQLKLLGSDVATFFEPSVECIVKAVLDQCKVAHKPISVRRFWYLDLLCFVLNFSLFFSTSFSLVDLLPVTGCLIKSARNCYLMAYILSGLKTMCPFRFLLQVNSS